MHTLKLNILRLIFSVFFVVTFSLASLAATPEWCKDGTSVKFAGATWESAEFYTELAQFIVKEGFDCKTEIIVGSKNVTETALASGDLDIWMEQWEGQNVITKKAAEDGKVRLLGSILDGGTLEGWFVPRYVVEGDPARNIQASAPDLRSVSDLKKYKNLFADQENPSKGRFLNCPSGWQCEKTNSQKLKAYGLTKDYVDFKPGTGGTLKAEIASAFTRGQPVLFYYWSPSDLLGKYDFYQLTEPSFNEKCWKTLFDTDNNQPCGSASPSTNLAAGVSIAFFYGAPEIVDFLEKLQMPANTLNRLIADLGDKKAPATELVKQFLSQNKSIWKSWVPEDVYNKLLTKI